MEKIMCYLGRHKWVKLVATIERPTVKNKGYWRYTWQWSCKYCSAKKGRVYESSSYVYMHQTHMKESPISQEVFNGGAVFCEGKTKEKILNGYEKGRTRT